MIGMYKNGIKGFTCMVKDYNTATGRTYSGVVLACEPHVSELAWFSPLTYASICSECTVKYIVNSLQQ